MVLSARVAVIGVLAGVLAALSPDPWLVLGVADGGLALATLLDALLAPAPAAIGIERFGDSRAVLGDAAMMGLALHNGSGRRVRGQVRDAWAPSTGLREPVLTFDLAAGETDRRVGTAVPARRGDHQPVGTYVRTWGPAGLAGRQAGRQVPGRLRVLPAFPARRHLPAAFARLQTVDARIAGRGAGQGAEFDSLRDYAPGDDVRSVDPRASARHRRVVVRTYRPERDRRLVLAVDAGRSAAARLDNSPRLDTYLDAALLLAALAHRGGDRIELFAYDRRPRAFALAARGPGWATPLVEAMADLRCELVESDPRPLATHLLARRNQRCLAVVFTELVPAGVEETLLPALSRVATRHVVLLAAVTDPATERLAAGRDSASEVYAAGAAERALIERRRLADRCAAGGIHVLDEVPERYASALAERYLDFKERGLP